MGEVIDTRIVINRIILERIKYEAVRGAGVQPNSKLAHDEQLNVILIQALTNVLKASYNVDVPFKLSKEILENE